jgi:hypothetical protein
MAKETPETQHPYLIIGRANGHRSILGIPNGDETRTTGTYIAELVVAIPVGRTNAQTYRELFPKANTGTTKARMNRARVAIDGFGPPILQFGRPPRFYFEDPEDTADEAERVKRKERAENDFTAWDDKHTFVRFTPHNGTIAVKQAGEMEIFTIKSVPKRKILSYFLHHKNESITTEEFDRVITETGHGITREVRHHFYKVLQQAPHGDRLFVRGMQDKKSVANYTLQADKVEFVDNEWQIETQGEELLQGLSKHDLSVIALALLTNKPASEKMTNRRVFSPDPDTLYDLVGLTDFPDTETTQQVIKENILQALLRIRQFIEHDDLEGKLDQLFAEDQDVWSLVTYLAQMKNAQSGKFNGLDMLNQFFIAQGAMQSVFPEQV